MNPFKANYYSAAILPDDKAINYSPQEMIFFSLSNTYIEKKVSKPKFINVYFVVRGSIQFTVFFFCLGKTQNPMFFSFLCLPDLEDLAKSDRTICQRDASIYLRQCVIDVFCSTSTERSRKSSSLLLTCCKKYRRKTET